MACEALNTYGPPAFPSAALLRARRSLRRYAAEAIDPSALERILTAATWAPSAHNRQPWRFAIVDRQHDKVTLASIMGRRLQADRLRHGDDPETIAVDAARSASRLAQAPCVVLVCVTMADMDIYPDAARSNAEYVMAVQSTAMAVQNLLLAAHGEGLGACVMCAPLFCPEEVVEALGLPQHWRPQCLVTLGRSTGPGKARDRKAVREVSLRVGETECDR